MLDGTPGAPRDIVLFNSAFGLLCAGIVDTVEDGLRVAAESIDSGRAQEKLEQLIRVSQEAPRVSA